MAATSTGTETVNGAIREDPADSSASLAAAEQEPLHASREDVGADAVPANEEVRLGETSEERHRRLNRESQAACANWPIIWKEWQRQLHMCGSVSLLGGCSVARHITGYGMVGRLGTLPLAGLAIGNAYSLLFGFSLLHLVISATSSQYISAAARKQHHLLPHHMLHSIGLSLLLCLPVTALFLCAKPLLILSGQHPDVASIAHSCVLASLPSLFMVALLEPLLACIAVLFSHPPGEALSGDEQAGAGKDRAASAPPAADSPAEDSYLEPEQLWPYRWPMAAVAAYVTAVDVAVCWCLVHPLGLGPPGVPLAGLVSNCHMGTLLIGRRLWRGDSWRGRGQGGLSLADFSLKVPWWWGAPLEPSDRGMDSPDSMGLVATPAAAVSLLQTIKLSTEFVVIAFFWCLVLISGLLSHPVAAIVTVAIALLPARIAHVWASSAHNTVYERLRLEIVKKHTVQVVVVSNVAPRLTLTLIAASAVLFSFVPWGPLFTSDREIADAIRLSCYFLFAAAAASHLNSFFRAFVWAFGGRELELTAAMDALYKVALPVMGVAVAFAPTWKWKVLSLCIGWCVGQATWLFKVARIRRRQREMNLARAPQDRTGGGQAMETGEAEAR